MHIYSWILGAGAALGLVWAAWLAPPRQANRTVDLGIAVLLGALVGGRALYVILNWGYYQSHWIEIPQVWQGGFFASGAWIGCLVMTGLLSFFTRRSWGVIADILVPLFAMLAVSSWLACWAAGCAYGAKAQAVWWAVPARDETGLVSPRWPTQPLGALLTLAWTWGLEWFWQASKNPGDLRRKFHSLIHIPGQSACLEWLGIALISWAISFKRVDPVPLWRGMRLDAWGALFLAVSSLVLYVLVGVRGRIGHYSEGGNTQPQDIVHG